MMDILGSAQASPFIIALVILTIIAALEGLSMVFGAALLLLDVFMVMFVWETTDHSARPFVPYQSLVAIFLVTTIGMAVKPTMTDATLP